MRIPQRITIQLNAGFIRYITVFNQNKTYYVTEV